jgi:hypothetical protein
MAVWLETVNLKDVWHQNLPWTEIRDIAVDRLKKTEWYTKSPLVRDIVADLESVSDLGEFNWVWNNLYDEADADRVWIATF